MGYSSLTDKVRSFSAVDSQVATIHQILDKQNAGWQDKNNAVKTCILSGILKIIKKMLDISKILIIFALNPVVK